MLFRSEPGEAFTASYRAEWDAFLAMIRGEQARTGLEEFLVLHRLMEAVGQSAVEHRDIAL